MKLGLQDPGATCNDCRWKIERNDCPWGFDYDNEHSYAEDCCDFRNANLLDSAFEVLWISLINSVQRDNLNRR